MHPDLPDEQARLDHAYHCLATMQAKAEHLADGLSVAARTDMDAAANRAAMLRYRAALDVGGTLCFGRIDADEGDQWYIGRRHVEDEGGDPLVVDWRAGVATPFYRATYRDPQGLHLRRRFTVEGHELTAIFDEDFTDPDGTHHGGGIPDPLLAELDRSRTGEMHDIVATIAAEQDEVIRAPLALLLVVQGGPGTGKTAVALHRAALLLYDHRAVLDREGVLVVGPNRRFLRYIASVLPSLGETAVVQTTLAGLGAVEVRGEEPDAVAAIKGDERMVAVLAEAAWGRVVPLAEEVSVSTTYGRITLRPAEVNALLDEALAERRTVNATRDRFRADVLGLAHARLMNRRPEGMKLTDDLAGALRRDAGLRRVLERVWPATTAEALVRKLLTSKATLAKAADGILAPAEQRLILRKAAKKADDEAWTVADAALIDEADALLGGRPRRYGHVVVDEAQDLSAMAWRMVGRRGAHGVSMTVLGDLAQSTAPAGQSDWAEVWRLLGGPEAVEHRELSMGYRVPGQILDFANRLLPATGASVRPSASVRATPAEPEVHRAADGEGELSSLVASVVERLAARWASVAVIVPDGLDGAVPDGLESAVVTVLSPAEAKGLEFDAVVVVEPAVLFDEGERGVRLLYVAMTRAVQHLALVHAAPLPAPLAEARQDGGR